MEVPRWLGIVGYLVSFHHSYGLHQMPLPYYVFGWALIPWMRLLRSFMMHHLMESWILCVWVQVDEHTCLQIVLTLQSFMNICFSVHRSHALICGSTFLVKEYGREVISIFRHVLQKHGWTCIKRYCQNLKFFLQIFTLLSMFRWNHGCI